jgi:dihydroflavonol-4-reductase
MKKAAIIGGSGFIGSYITKTFLDNGFQIKVSTTDIKRKNKYQHLIGLNHSDNLHICELDVTDKFILQDFISDCDIIIHCGTPYLLNHENAQTQIFDPTIKGTQNFIDIISHTPGIEKIVFIASVEAWNTNFPMPAGSKSFTDTFDENDTKFSSAISHPYAQAKFIANQLVEKFIQENPNLDLEISSVSPVLVMGKAISKRKDATSTSLQFLIKNKKTQNIFIKSLFNNDFPLAIVDVEDVANAVFKIAITKNLHGKNYLLSSETYKVSDIYLMLNHQEPKEKAQIIYKNDLSKNDLGISFRPVIQTLHDFSTNIR